MDDRVASLTDAVTDEIFVALGTRRDGALRRRLGGIVARPVRRLAELVVEFDRRVGEAGPAAGCGWLLTHFTERVDILDVTHVPLTGPVLVVTNHPGAYDGFSLISGLPRNDVKVLSSEVKVFESLPHVSQHLIQTDRDPYKRLRAVRTAIRHLQGGGCLVTFASGFLDPDPLAYPGAPTDARAALRNWSPSLELLLRKAPATCLIPTMIGGVVAPRWARHPLVRYRRRQHDRRKLAEFMQVIYQLMFPGRLRMTPHVAFGPPVTTDALLLDEPGSLDRIIARAEVTLERLLDV